MSETPQDPVGWIVPQIGEPKIRALVTAFYRRVADDDVLAPMYPPEDMRGAEQRLADFLVERCGGEPCYSSTRGHPRLRMRHAGFAIDQRARDRWMSLMREALAEVALSEAAARELDPFLDGVATFMINRG